MSNRTQLWGVSLLVLAFSFDANAQTCKVPPTCESMGFNKSAADCGELPTLKCPFDDSKLFCTAYTDANGKKVAEIGDIVYTDAISAEPISGRVPVGIVYDLSGKMMSIAEYKNSSSCAAHAADGVNGWTLASIEDMSMIKNQISKIQAKIGKLPGASKITTDRSVSVHGSEARYYTTSTPACMMADVAIASDKDYGCFSLYTTKARCVRTFSAGGAGSSPDVSLTPGSAYIDDTGTNIGTVVTTNATGTHGTIVNRAVRSGEKAAAITYCEGFKTGGLTWYLPSFEHMAKACEVKAYGYRTSMEFWISDSGYYDSYSVCSDPSGNKPGGAGTKSYFCAANF